MTVTDDEIRAYLKLDYDAEDPEDLKLEAHQIALARSAIADVRAHLNLDHDEDDALLAKKVAAARGWIENYTARSFYRQDLPSELHEAVLQLVAHWYESRIELEGAGVPIAVRSLCSPFIRFAV